MKNFVYLLFTFIIFFISSCEKVETEDSAFELRDEEYNIDIINKVTLEEINCISNSAIKKLFKDSNRDTTTVKEIEELKDNENESSTLIYIVSYEEGGFLIISADKRFTPILAFGDTEEWGSEDMGGIDVWVHCTKEKIKKSMINFEEPPKHVQVQWDNYLENNCDPVDPHDPINPDYPHDPDCPSDPPDPDPCPLNEQWWQTGRYVDAVAQWRQGGIFSFFSPEDNECDPCDKKSAGCGSIAMAMIMRYYQSPTGTICYGLQGTPNCATLNSYEYSIMPVTVNPWNCGTPMGGDRSASILTRACGSAANSDYGVFGNCSTATYWWDIPDAFESMGYNSGGDWGGFSEKNVETRSDLRNFNPVLFTGTLNNVNLNNWHIWVGDGLQTKTYHYMGYDPYDYNNNGDGGDGECYSTTIYYYGMNWGWGGISNGYFLANGSFTTFGLMDNSTYDTYIKTLTNIRP